MSTWSIKMLEDHRGSDDGFSVRLFIGGHVYTVGQDIGDTLARRFIAQGKAAEIDDNQTVAAPSGACYNV